MTACYGFIYPDSRSGNTCARCKENYYAHSHLEYRPNGENRIRRYPIRLRLKPGDQCGVEARKGMPDGYRSVYDRMMDRQPTATDWLRAKGLHPDDSIARAVAEAIEGAKMHPIPPHIIKNIETAAAQASKNLAAGRNAYPTAGLPGPIIFTRD